VALSITAGSGRGAYVQVGKAVVTDPEDPELRFDPFVSTFVEVMFRN
jgi:hypothetical protein